MVHENICGQSIGGSSFVTHSAGSWGVVSVEKAAVAENFHCGAVIVRSAASGMGQVIGRAFGGSPHEAYANALLMAAAPTLLTELEKIEAYLRGADPECELHHSVIAALEVAISGAGQPDPSRYNQAC